jgi:hypothetical protein
VLKVEKKKITASRHQSQHDSAGLAAASGNVDELRLTCGAVVVASEPRLIVERRDVLPERRSERAVSTLSFGDPNSFPFPSDSLGKEHGQSTLALVHTQEDLRISGRLLLDDGVEDDEIGPKLCDRDGHAVEQQLHLHIC